MFKKTTLSIATILPAAVMLSLLIPALATAGEIEESRSATTIGWTPRFEYASATIAVSGPAGVTSWTAPFGTAAEIETAALAKWAKSRNVSADGDYRFEVRFAPRLSNEVKERLEAERQANGEVPEAMMQKIQLPVVSGYFQIQGGTIVGADNDAASAEGLAAKDVLHYDDVIATGSLCVGFDCADGESFGYDTARLKENNIRLNFDDTSIGTFPANDWRVVINDTTSGGASYFGIEDSTAGVKPFVIEAGSPANSLYVEDYGRVGLGTSVPVVELHIKDGDTPTTRLEQDSSSGWAAQTWDLAGNETNFFIRDVSNGSKLPFRIEPSTPSSTLSLKSSGYVGLGTWSPATPLEIETTGESATVLLDRTDGGQWYLASTADGTFTISATGAAGEELLILDSLGNLTTSGTVNGISDRQSKLDFTPVDTAQILEAVASLSVTSWRLVGDDPETRHLGPTAQDFYAAFGIGSDDRHIASSDLGGVALAAIQALVDELESRNRQIDDLERRLEKLEQKLH